MQLKEGDKAPTFKVNDQDNKLFDLEKAKGKKMVLYFYPKDDTPGCTKESCEFRDLKSEYEKVGASIYGMSADDATSHQQFISKYSLNFPLLADIGHKVADQYGVWVIGEHNGKKYEGIARTTFIISEKGNIEKIYPQVNPVGHADEILNYLKQARTKS